MKIIGHDDILQYLDKCVEKNNLHHAYLFSGPTHVGKGAVVAYLAERLTGLPVTSVNSHYIYIGREINEKTGKLKMNIDVSQIRDLRSRISHKSAVGEYTIVHIDQAESLNIAASNALLKTLEEPRGNTIIFLTTSRPGMLPATIISRTHQLEFFRASDDEVREVVAGGKHEDEIVDASSGLVGKALLFLEDDDALSVAMRHAEEFDSLWDLPLYKKKKVIEHLYGDKTDHIAQREIILEVLDIWMAKLVQKYLGDPSKMKQCARVSDNIFRAKKLIQMNIHPKLVVESILHTMNTYPI